MPQKCSDSQGNQAAQRQNRVVHESKRDAALLGCYLYQGVSLPWFGVFWLSADAFVPHFSGAVVHAMTEMHRKLQLFGCCLISIIVIHLNFLHSLCFIYCIFTGVQVAWILYCCTRLSGKWLNNTGISLWMLQHLFFFCYAVIFWEIDSYWYRFPC